MCVTVGKGAGIDHWADHRRVQESVALRDALPSQWEGTELACKYVSVYRTGCKGERKKYWGETMGRRVEDELRGSGLRIWWSRTSCWQGACWNLAGPRASWCLPGSAYLRPSPWGQSARRREEGGTRGGHETGVSGGHWATLTNPRSPNVHVD